VNDGRRADRRLSRRAERWLASERGWTITSIVIVAAVSIAFVAPIFRDPRNWGVLDWDQFLFYRAVPRATLREYGEFPLWNPYHSGGLPNLANPQSPFLTMKLNAGVLPLTPSTTAWNRSVCTPLYRTS
jgi:hypothetical protein